MHSETDYRCLDGLDSIDTMVSAINKLQSCNHDDDPAKLEPHGAVVEID